MEQKELYKKKKTINYNKLKKRMLLLIISIAFLTFVGTKFISKALTTTTTYPLTYKEKGKIDYRVYLKKNNYFEKDYLDKNLQYVASLIDHIKVDFNYTFKSSDKVDYDYSYYIVGTLEATEQDNENAVLYSKDYTLLEEKKLSKSSKKYIINESLDIDYGKYNTLISKFKSDYTLNLNSKLIIKLIVTTKGDYKEFKNSISNIGKTELSIPLSEKTINISLNANEANNTNMIEKRSRFGFENILCFVIGTLFIIVDIALIIRYFMYVKKFFRKISTYMKKTRKILKEYDRIITNVENIPDLTGLQVINVTSFEEMVDTSERIEKPILFYEVEKNTKSVFILLDKNIAYYYEITATK